MLVWLVSCLLSWFTEPVMTLNIEFTNIKKNQGKLWIAIYKPEEKFASKEKPKIYRIVDVKALPLSMLHLS